MLQIKMKKSIIQREIDEAKRRYSAYDPFKMERLSLWSSMLEYVDDEEFVFIDEEIFKILRF
jgi:hypothetical protein